MKMKNSVFSYFILFLLLSGSCCSKPKIQLKPPCATPAQLQDGWKTGDPRKMGVNEEALCSVLSTVENGESNIHAVLIERGGQLIAETYHQGPDRPIHVFYGLLNPFSFSTRFDAQTLHDTRSISKSIVSLVYGIALEQKKIDSLEQPVLPFFPELKNLPNQEELSSIKLTHLLTMTSGLEWDEGGLPNDETRLYWTKDQARFLFDRNFKSKPGQEFHYNSGGSAMLAEILGRVTRKPWLEFVQTHLFEPLEIKKWEWVTDLRGRPLAFTGLRMLPRDMLKVGRLVLDKGRWNGKQIIPEKWIEESTKSHISTGIKLGSDSELAYGYQWWTGHLIKNGKTLNWIAAFGNGGQRIFVVPGLDLTVVITAGEYHSGPINQIVQQLFTDIVKSIEDQEE